MNDLNIVLSGLKNEDKSTFDILNFLVKKKQNQKTLIIMIWLNG